MRDKIIEVMARGLCRLRIQNNLRYDTKGRTSEWVRLAEDAGWLSFSDEASAALTALQAEGMTVVPVEPSNETIKRMVAHAMKIQLGSNCTWEDYMTDLYRLASASPAHTQEKDA